ncbi:hypothetical protein CU102_26925 [Phyllobacterium brassicacearum]|uniref:Uncharacterized protein n=1 Tax=Phyllobacterium brassicacearum TaxID=314235 RepID=A0A2P7B4T9_9HYPH|nr:hypothetical protein [Phyllobacterium brassicacearum]PSH61459.1 hypothetical protein CU102_26925 [Phyllobacterium brassicacearum]TDQ35198.1 hypothetical protein DEV91_102402 [Phyllobacterium brassicacearum]
MQGRTTILVTAIIAVLAIAAVFLTSNPTNDADRPGQPSPHALDQSN